MSLESLDALVQAYYTEISSIINKHAPLQSKSIILRPNTDWYSDELRSAKTERRKAEREMRKTQLSVHKDIYREKCTMVIKLLYSCKKEFFSTKINEIGNGFCNAQFSQYSKMITSRFSVNTTTTVVETPQKQYTGTFIDRLSNTTTTVLETPQKQYTSTFL
jgi:hypothetical protein